MLIFLFSLSLSPFRPCVCLCVCLCVGVCVSNEEKCETTVLFWRRSSINGNTTQRGCQSRSKTSSSSTSYSGASSLSSSSSGDPLDRPPPPTLSAVACHRELCFTAGQVLAEQSSLTIQFRCFSALCEPVLACVSLCERVPVCRLSTKRQSSWTGHLNWCRLIVDFGFEFVLGWRWGRAGGIWSIFDGCCEIVVDFGVVDRLMFYGCLGHGLKRASIGVT